MFSSLWLGDPVKDYDQPREHENVNYRKFYIRPKSKPQSRFDMIVKGNFFQLYTGKSLSEVLLFA